MCFCRGRAGERCAAESKMKTPGRTGDGTALAFTMETPHLTSVGANFKLKCNAGPSLHRKTEDRRKTAAFFNKEPLRWRSWKAAKAVLAPKFGGGGMLLLAGCR
jgi:hypothetical protein